MRLAPDDVSKRQSLASALMGLAEALLDKKDQPENAIAMYREAIRLTDDIDFRYFLALWLRKLGRETEATQELQQVLRSALDRPGYESLVEEARALLRELEPQPK